MCHGIVRMHMRGSTRMHSRGSRGWQPWHSRGSRGSSSACMHMRGSTSSSAWRDAEEDTPSTRDGEVDERTADKLALLPSVKRQVLCVMDRSKMVKDHVWATTTIAPKSVGSMATKGQMKPTCRVSSTGSRQERTAKEMSPNMRSYPVF